MYECAWAEFVSQDGGSTERHQNARLHAKKTAVADVGAAKVEGWRRS
jgi:hypothetical protein